MRLIGIFKNRRVLWKNKKDFVAIGNNSKVETPYTVWGGVEIGSNTRIIKNSYMQIMNDNKGVPYGSVYIGNNVMAGENFVLTASADIVIEDFVAIAGDVFITSGNHGLDPESELCYGAQQYRGLPVLIKKGSWIGRKVCILSGVTIGEKCIIGAGSVVTKSVPSYSIAVGNPARVIKKWDFKKHNWITVSEDMVNGK